MTEKAKVIEAAQILQDAGIEFMRLDLDGEKVLWQDSLIHIPSLDPSEFKSKDGVRIVHCVNAMADLMACLLENSLDEVLTRVTQINELSKEIMERLPRELELRKH